MDFNQRPLRLTKFDVMPSISRELSDTSLLSSLTYELNTEPNVNESIVGNFSAEEVDIFEI